MKKIIVLLQILTYITLFPILATAGTTFIINPNRPILGPDVDYANIDRVGNDFRKIPQNLYKSNKEIFGTGMSLANPLGYPTGDAILKPFPTIEFGWAIGGSVHEYERMAGFDIDVEQVRQQEVPVFADGIRGFQRQFIGVVDRRVGRVGEQLGREPGGRIEGRRHGSDAACAGVSPTVVRASPSSATRARAWGSCRPGNR